MSVAAFGKARAFSMGAEGCDKLNRAKVIGLAGGGAACHIYPIFLWRLDISPHIYYLFLMLNQLDHRSQDIFRRIVDAYLDTGVPVGSKTLSTGLGLSPATIRSVMASLEQSGLLFSPHTSAGRIPTHLGLKLFVDGLLEVGSLTGDEQEGLTAHCKSQGTTLKKQMEAAVAHLSGLSQCTGLVIAPKAAAAIRHIEFMYLEPGKALAVVVDSNGQVENRIMDIPLDMTASHLQRASNYLNVKLSGQTLGESADMIRQELASQRAELDVLSQKVVEQGLAIWADTDGKDGTLIVKGQAHLLDTVEALSDLDRIQALFDDLETKETLLSVLSATDDADGVQIYIGAENEMFRHTGCSMILSNYRDHHNTVVGAIGVIGPTRLNYGRIIPMVDYTAKVISKLIS